MQNWTPRQRKPRRYRRRNPSLRFRRGRLALVLGVALALFGTIRLIGYAADWLGARQTSRTLQSVYHEAATDEPSSILPTAAPAEAPTPSPVPAPQASTALPLPPFPGFRNWAIPTIPGRTSATAASRITRMKPS